MTVPITRCPNCGSGNIKQVRRRVKGEYLGEPYAAPGITFYACPACGEHVYDPEAIRKIQSYRPSTKGKRVGSASLPHRKTG